MSKILVVTDVAPLVVAMGFRPGEVLVWHKEPVPPDGRGLRPCIGGTSPFMWLQAEGDEKRELGGYTFLGRLMRRLSKGVLCPVSAGGVRCGNRLLLETGGRCYVLGMVTRPPAAHR